MTTHNPNNERIKRRYFVYLKKARRQSEDSVDAAAKAIARFEADTKYRVQGVPLRTGRRLQAPPVEPSASSG